MVIWGFVHLSWSILELYNEAIEGDKAFRWYGDGREGIKKELPSTKEEWRNSDWVAPGA